MCGIAGIFDLTGVREVDREALARMAAALAHRGPDGEGAFFAPGLGLAHRRLAIIDVAGGGQPFIAERGGALTFNGEIYNFQELTADLAAMGARFRTRSDTEALAEGLARYGKRYIEKLRGMFAFGYFEPDERSLTLARDRIGERPLYYAKTPQDWLIFASEIGAVIASGLVDRRLDHEALSDYFLYGFIPDPKAIYAGIRKLPPASVLTARRGGSLVLETYWRPGFEPDRALNYKAAEATLLDLIDDAVRAEMVSDVPLGAFLSGGVDSSAVVAAMAKTGAKVMTSTVGFLEEAFDERRFARVIADLFKTEHTERVAGLDASALIDVVARAFGEPFADASALPTYIVSKIARERVTVALSGDGGDEVFAGYRRYRFARAAG